MTTEVAVSPEELEKMITEIETAERTPTIAPPAPASVSVVTGAPVDASLTALREYVNPEQLSLDVAFDVNDLDNVVMSHASRFVYYANQARLARRQFERIKAIVEVIESGLDAQWRLKMTEDGGKKPTEAAIEKAVKADPRWFRAQSRLIDARAIYDFANDAREAFMQRKDMIVQVSVDRRRERDGQLRVMEQTVVDQARERAMAGVRATVAAAGA